jgi:hypothetical protein
VWHWNVFSNKEDIDHILNNENIVICGPNTFFSDPRNINHCEQYIFSSKRIHEFFLHPNQYSNYEFKYIREANNNIYDFLYPVDIDMINECKNNKMNKNRDIDILLYCKFEYQENYDLIMKRYASKYKIETLLYGNYEKLELINTALRSKCCIYLSTGETGGIACCEIFCCGCPIISHKNNLNLGDDTINCFKLNGNQDFYWFEKKTNDIIIKAMNMDNDIIMDLAQQKFHPDNIIKTTIDTIDKLRETYNNHSNK